MIVEKALFLNTPHFLLITIIFSLITKGCLLGILIPHRFRTHTVQIPLALLICVIFGSLAGEIVWLLKLLRILSFPAIPYTFIIFGVRTAWAFLIIQYWALGIFLESLSEKRFRFHRIQKLLTAVSSIFVTYYFYLAFFGESLIDEQQRRTALVVGSSYSPYFEITVMRHTVFYLIPLLIIPSLCIVVRKLKGSALPKILRHQLSAIIKYLLFPFLCMELLLATSFIFKSLRLYTYAIEGISALLITYLIYFCIRHVIAMRFLNANGKVQSKRHDINFIDDFKLILEQLSFATTIQEFEQITATFIKSTCGISSRKVFLRLRKSLDQTNNTIRSTLFEEDVERFLTTASTDIQLFIKENKILIHDELAFTNFYQESTLHTDIIAFLDTINADIFLPIYSKDQLLAYIIVERNARPKQLYSNVEHNEMVVLANYLANIINLLQNRNFDSLLLQQYELKHELFYKHQEINQYKESIRSFIKQNDHESIGIIFYKQRRFIFANQSAKEMIQANPHTQEGHPLVRALKTIARQVEEYKTPQSILAKDIDGTPLVIAGMPHIEHNTVIITVANPDIAYIINKQLTRLKDPNSWDYLLYLETNKLGKLISHLFPSSTETFLNFKIALLQAALNPKPLLLEINREDLMPVVELLHHISLRDNLHILKLTGPSHTNEIGTKLFGINPVYGSTEESKPLLEKLDTTGTLLIKNIQYLDLESQEHLTEFITYGLYRPLKSNHHHSSSVRIICSSESLSLPTVQEKNFSNSLYTVLKKNTISMPSLLTIPEHELLDLANGLVEQMVQTNDFKLLLELSDKDKMRIIASRPVSVQELKIKVQQILTLKSKKNNVEADMHFDPAYETIDPELTQAASLGKHALRDHKIMNLLWNKFKNQNKIAMFLGVNRSSVNRRCKEYNLM